MYYGSLPDIDNNVTWDEALYFYDDETDQPIDLTGALITMTITDNNDCKVLTGSTTEGTIVLSNQVGTFQFNFNDTALNRLCGTYNVDIRMSRDGITRKLFRGTINIIEGTDR